MSSIFLTLCFCSGAPKLQTAHFFSNNQLKSNPFGKVLNQILPPWSHSWFSRLNVNFLSFWHDGSISTCEGPDCTLPWCTCLLTDYMLLKSGLSQKPRSLDSRILPSSRNSPLGIPQVSQPAQPALNSLADSCLLPGSSSWRMSPLHPFAQAGDVGIIADCFFSIIRHIHAII